MTFGVCFFIILGPGGSVSIFLRLSHLRAYLSFVYLISLQRYKWDQPLFKWSQTALRVGPFNAMISFRYSFFSFFTLFFDKK